jgi:hypothetical protein
MLRSEQLTSAVDLTSGEGQYERTKISLDQGEHWFCSEREALDAGWRAPLR